MAKQTNRVEWEFLLNQRQLDQGLRKAQGGFQKTQKESSTLGKAMGSLKTAAIGLGLSFGAMEAIRFGQELIEDASDYAESLNAIDVAAGGAAKEIVEFGDDAAQAIGLSKTEVNEAAVAFSGFATKIGGEGRVADKFEEYITRAADFASVMNIEIPDATAKFQSALAGESEPLRRYGIDISAAATNTFALAEGIIEVGEQLTDDQKVLARYGLLMQETGKFAGDFANTSHEVANAQKVANAEMENARIELGQHLIPVQEKWIQVQLLAAKALGGLAVSLDNTTKEQELLSRQMFQYALEAGKVTGTYEEMIAGTTELGKESSWLSNIWDGLVGRTQDLDIALEEIQPEVKRVSVSMAQSDSVLIDYGESLDVVTVSAKEAADALAATAAASRKIIAARLENLELDKIFGAGAGISPTPLAAGGTARAGQAHIVGEQGPELFVPGRTGTVIPNGAGGGGNTYNINITAIDPAGAAQAVADAIRLYESTNGPI